MTTEQPQDVQPIALEVSLAQLYADLFQYKPVDVPRFVPRQQSQWAALIPQIVPSVTTFGAYEQPI